MKRLFLEKLASYAIEKLRFDSRILGKTYSSAKLAKAKKTGLNAIAYSIQCQNLNGTTYQKVPYHVICLGEIVKEHKAEKAYLVLGGSHAWPEVYLNNSFNEFVTNGNSVEIIDANSFANLALNESL